VAVLSALAGVTAIAWAYLVVRAAGMGDMGAGGAMTLMEIRPWTGLDFLLMFLMWAVMMVGMMVPTAAPMTLLYAGMARKAARQSTPMAPVALFVSGYIVMWSLFSVGATLAQWGLERAALLSPMMVATSPRLGAGLLIAAGLYQLTPLKEACLEHCRSPAHFIAQHWQPGPAGAFRLGLRHGAYCLGCCWVLMLLLFVGGVMNLLWIAGLAVFVLLEKVPPLGKAGGKLAGGGLILAGIGLFLSTS
jgi:predicted metal-binding membrane protein